MYLITDCLFQCERTLSRFTSQIESMIWAFSSLFSIFRFLLEPPFAAPAVPCLCSALAKVDAWPQLPWPWSSFASTWSLCKNHLIKEKVTLDLAHDWSRYNFSTKHNVIIYYALASVQHRRVIRCNYITWSYTGSHVTLYMIFTRRYARFDTPPCLLLVQL